MSILVRIKEVETIWAEILCALSPVFSICTQCNHSKMRKERFEVLHDRNENGNGALFCILYVLYVICDALHTNNISKWYSYENEFYDCNMKRKDFFWRCCLFVSIFHSFFTCALRNFYSTIHTKKLIKNARYIQHENGICQPLEWKRIVMNFAIIRNHTFCIVHCTSMHRPYTAYNMRYTLYILFCLIGCSQSSKMLFVWVCRWVGIWMGHWE